MSFTHVVTERVTIGGVTITEQNTLTAGQKISIDEAVAIANDVLIAMSVDVSQVKSVYILCDQDVLLETNSSSSPAQTLSLKAGIPYIWYTNKYSALVFSTDITALYVTNATASVANLQLEILTDPTV
jgi:hypothetical protein